MNNPIPYSVVSTRWQCHDPNHAHKSETVAIACIKKQEASLLHQRARKERSLHRDALMVWILDARNRGMTLRAIAQRIGRSAGRVQQLIRQAQGEQHENASRELKLLPILSEIANCAPSDDAGNAPYLPASTLHELLLRR